LLCASLLISAAADVSPDKPADEQFDRDAADLKFLDDVVDAIVPDRKRTSTMCVSALPWPCQSMQWINKMSHVPRRTRIASRWREEPSVLSLLCWCRRTKRTAPNTLQALSEWFLAATTKTRSASRRPSKRGLTTQQPESLRFLWTSVARALLGVGYDCGFEAANFFCENLAGAGACTDATGAAVNCVGTVAVDYGQTMDDCLLTIRVIDNSICTAIRDPFFGFLIRGCDCFLWIDCLP